MTDDATPAVDPLRIGITGASGLIGTALRRSLLADGHEVFVFVRRSARDKHERRWDPSGRGMQIDDVSDLDAIVNLSGPNIGGKRWTTSYKRELLQSRLSATGAVASALVAAYEQDGKTRRLVSASAVGYYGDTGANPTLEDSAQGAGFLADLCQQWESAALAANGLGARVAVMRTGLVCDRAAPLIKKQLPLIKLGIGGPLGSGRQYWPLIALEDHVRAQAFLLADQRGRDITGAVNLVGPEPVTNADTTKILGGILHRPTLLRVPGFALKAVLGEFAEEGVLIGQRAVPAVLNAHGFEFRYKNPESILRSAVGTTNQPRR